MIMDALSLLLHRHSESSLIEPAPSGEKLENILQAAMRAPDHGRLSPYRFYIIEGDARERFSQLLQKAAKNENMGEKMEGKAKRGPFKAPMIIAVVAHYEPHERVSALDQQLAAGCALYSMQLAALAQGFGGIWRTGFWADSPTVRAALDCREQDTIVGFLYLGTPEKQKESVLNKKAIQDFTRYF